MTATDPAEVPVPSINGNALDLVWLAGLLEGEGAFDLHRERYPRIRLGMTDRDVVERAAALIGSRVRLSLRPAPAQATWHTEVSGVRAAEVMRLLLPFMGTRRSGKIATVLGHQALRGAKATASTPGPRVMDAQAAHRALAASSSLSE